MKKSFLDSLVNLPLDTANKTCAKAGFKTIDAQHGTAMVALAMPNTVILWIDVRNNTVMLAEAGDPLELD